MSVVEVEQPLFRYQGFITVPVLGVLIPKPHSPFDTWAMDEIGKLKRRIRELETDLAALGEDEGVP